MTVPERNRPSAMLALKWRVFRLLERLAGNDRRAPPVFAGKPRQALWVFVSTIGELNAIGPFLRDLVDRLSDLQLVLITDRSIYRASYLEQHPQAEVVEIDADNGNAAVLARTRPPALFVVAEIPCLPSDAPCRLPFGYLYEAKRAGSRIALVNGWLYHYAPACRMDSLERSWLGRDYIRLFDVLAVQNEDVAKSLIAAGAEEARVHVTGNIKFDALDGKPRPREETRSPQLLESLAQGDRPVIVAGCVTDDEERDLILDAFLLLRSNFQTAVLVLAPRHPENPKKMKGLAAALSTRRLSYRLRSASTDAPFVDEEAVLALDTMGELRDFYAVATLAHVGRNHNVLEPLAYGKPVSVRPGWDPAYPSYPVFSVLRTREALFEAASPVDLFHRWCEMFSERPAAQQHLSKALLAERGASLRCLRALGGVYAGLSPTEWG